VPIWTVDQLTSIDIYNDNITWTGNHTFNGTVTFAGTLYGTTTFDGAMLIDDTLHVTGNTALDADLSVGGTFSVDEITVSLINLGTAGTIADVFGAIAIASADDVVLSATSIYGPILWTFGTDGNAATADGHAPEQSRCHLEGLRGTPL